MSEPQPLHDDESGELVGWTQSQDDGAILAFDAEGELLGAAYGEQWYDLDELELADDAGGPAANGYDAQASALDERLADLEQRVSEPRAPAPYAAAPEIDRDAMANDVQADRDRLERLLDRPLLASEWRRMVSSMSEAEVAGQAVPDVEGAAIRLAQEGRGVLDLDGGSDHQQRAARQEYQRQRLEEIERSENPADDLLSDVAPASAELYDLDSRSERHAYLNDRLRGATDPDSTYTSSNVDEDASLG